mgnify:CR=1 FL=1
MQAVVIGGGLAGCEAAWQLAERGVQVTLCEQKPEKYSPAHHYAGLSELVCSNSLRAAGLSNAVGLLKEEMRRLHSVIMACADLTAVPAGGALAVDRQGFSDAVTAKITQHPNITVVHGEVTALDISVPTVVASGPLTEGALLDSIRAVCGGEFLHFYDAAAPIVAAGSIDMDIAYRAARYGKGGADYINCPMTKEQYEAFYDALIHAELAPVHGADGGAVFEGCMPVEVMAKRGPDTLTFGPLKPVGLPDPRTGKLPYAVVQLRQDNTAGTMYNLVGFQTRLKFGEQKRVFSMIPGLEQAEFLRYGVMHRNTFLNAPALLDETYRLRSRETLYFAGQMTGVEGYVESAASGLTAGLSLARRLCGQPAPDFPIETAIGALAHYIAGGAAGDFQPMNVNFGLMAPLEKRVKGKKEKNEAIARRALEAIGAIAAELE